MGAGCLIFTGIVQGVCHVSDISRQAGLVAIRVDLGGHAEGLRPGASVAINGVCLTTTAVRGENAAFDLVAETRRATNLGALRVGDLVNVERSLRVGDEIGGNVLSGHIAATCDVVAIDAAAGRRLVTATVPRKWMPYVLAKGFVALNGVSLTVAELDRGESTVSVSLIPETLSRTTFDQVAVGDALNLEVDAQTQAVVDTVRAMLPEVIQHWPGNREVAPTR